MQIVTGGVYTVADEAITLPPDDEREYHATRTVIVVSGPETNSDPSWKVVLVCPTSGSTRRKTRFCVKLNSGDGNLVKKCWVRVPAVQPLLKAQLEDYWGVLPEEKLELVHGRLAEYMGLIDGEDDVLDNPEFEPSAIAVDFGPDEAPF